MHLSGLLIGLGDTVHSGKFYYVNDCLATYVTERMSTYIALQYIDCWIWNLFAVATGTYV